MARGVARSQGRGGIGVRVVRRVLLSRVAHAGGHDGRYPRSGDFYGGYGYRGGHVRDDRAHSAGRDGGKCWSRAGGLVVQGGGGGLWVEMSADVLVQLERSGFVSCAGVGTKCIVRPFCFVSTAIIYSWCCIECSRVGPPLNSNVL